MDTFLTLVFYGFIIGEIISGALFLWHAHAMNQPSTQMSPAAYRKQLDLAMKSLVTFVSFAPGIILSGSVVLF